MRIEPAAWATGLFTAAAKADPTDSRISLRLGQLLAAQGKLAEAVHYFREAARLSSEDAEAHESLGRALSELGKNDEAARHLREAIRILRSTPAAHCSLAAARLISRYYQFSVRNQPSDPADR